MLGHATPTPCAGAPAELHDLDRIGLSDVECTCTIRNPRHTGLAKRGGVPQQEVRYKLDRSFAAMREAHAAVCDMGMRIAM